MSYLENNHICLQQQVDTKVARDAEFHDWIQNKNEEDWLVFKGLPRLTDVTNQEWPKAAAKQVIDAINPILKANRARLDFDVLYVANPFKLQNTGPTTYNVRMDSVFSSKRLREVFSGFFRHHKPVPLPPALKGVSLRNRINLETKIRISILHQLGGIYRDSNAGASYKVRGYDPRPVLLTIPPRSGSGRARTYNFIQAATTLPATFSDEQLVRIFQVVGDRFRGHLQALFIVLRDDDHDRCLELVRIADRRPNRARQPVSGANAIPSGSATSVGHTFLVPVPEWRLRPIGPCMALTPNHQPRSSLFLERPASLVLMMPEFVLVVSMFASPPLRGTVTVSSVVVSPHPPLPNVPRSPRSTRSPARGLVGPLQDQLHLVQLPDPSRLIPRLTRPSLENEFTTLFSLNDVPSIF